MLMITKGGYLWIFSHTYRYDWFLSQTASTALKYETLFGFMYMLYFWRLTVSLTQPALKGSYYAHQRGQETVLQEDSPSFQRQQRHSEPVAWDSDHYRLQAPTTDLWQHHPPAERAECLLCSLWGTKQHHCTENSTSSRRPGDDAVPEQCEEIPQQDQCTKKLRVLTTFLGTERLCSGTHWCLQRHFQHLAKSGCCPHMLQSYHHHSSPEEVISILLQWLPSSSTHSYSHEVLWTASHATHQVCPPPLPGPSSSLHIGPTAWPMMSSPLPSTQPSHIWTKKTRMSDCCS